MGDGLQCCLNAPNDPLAKIMNKLSKHSFFRACGGSRPIKLLLENRETGAQDLFVFEQASILVGQHPFADIRLQHLDIGQRHLYLQLLDGQLFGVAFPGEKPTHWGDFVQTCGWVDQEMRFGAFALRVVEGIAQECAVSRADPMVSSPNGVPPICLEHRWLDPQRTFRGIVNRSLSLVGNAELCKFRIRSNRVSSLHCSLVRADHGVWAVDLSGGGVLLNGAAVSIALLEEGDLLQLGAIPFYIHYGTAVANEPKALAAAQPKALVKAPRQAASTMDMIEPNQEAFERMIGPVLDRFTAFQNQTFQQFQDLLGNVMQMFGSMFQQQQEFVREEMQRYNHLTDEINRLRQAIQSFPTQTPSVPALPAPPLPARVAPPQPEPSLNAPALDPQMHLWLQSRITQLDEQRNNLWSRLTSLFRGKNAPTEVGSEENNIGKSPGHSS
jgi:hypothetical protein